MCDLPYEQLPCFWKSTTRYNMRIFCEWNGENKNRRQGINRVGTNRVDPVIVIMIFYFIKNTQLYEVNLRISMWNGWCKGVYWACTCVLSACWTDKKKFNLNIVYLLYVYIYLFKIIIEYSDYKYLVADYDFAPKIWKKKLKLIN